MKRALRVVLAALVLVLELAAPRRAAAHPSPTSDVVVDLGPTSATLELDVPIEELELALDRSLWDPARGADAYASEHQAELESYVAAHVSLRDAATGAPWPVAAVSVRSHAAADGPRLAAHVELSAPERTSGDVLLDDDVVIHQVRSHVTIVHAPTAKGDAPELVGSLRADRTTLLLHRRASTGAAFVGVVRLGAEHVLSGADHVLFLVMLVLAAPLGAVGGRWGARKPLRATARALAELVTAFTAGHTITLALGSLGIVHVPAAIVEPLVALSIVVTGVHVLRPIFPRAELGIAGGFGLVHGLAFASAVLGRSIDGHPVLALFGFNVGVELAQLGLLALVGPWVVLASRTDLARPVRWAGGGAGCAIALGWILERTCGVQSPFGGLVAAVAAHPLAVLIAFALLTSVAALGAQRVGGAPASAVGAGSSGQPFAGSVPSSGHRSTESRTPSPMSRSTSAAVAAGGPSGTAEEHAADESTAATTAALKTIPPVRSLA